jgi:hypothetical protein
VPVRAGFFVSQVSRPLADRRRPQGLRRAYQAPIDLAAQHDFTELDPVENADLNLKEEAVLIRRLTNRTWEQS